MASHMDALTIHEAAETTGWSPRMLRYVERVGLLGPAPFRRRLPALRAGGAPAPAHPARAARAPRARPLRRRLRAPAPPGRGAARGGRHVAGRRRRSVLSSSPRPTGCAGSRRSTRSCWPPPSAPIPPSWRRDDHHHDRLQGRRHRPGRLRPQGDRARRARDARPDGAARGVRRRPAAQGRAHHRLAAHDRPDGRADRDARRARRRRALVLVQHLLDAGPRRRRDRRRRHPRLRLEGRDARGVLVVHGAGADLARGRPEHDPRRRRRRHAPRPQGRRVRGRRRRAGPRVGRQRGVQAHPRACSTARSRRTRSAGPASPPTSRA